MLRIRLLHLLEHEFLGVEVADQIGAGIRVCDLPLATPWHPELPTEWWDLEADKSLLCGYYKHGGDLLSPNYTH